MCYKLPICNNPLNNRNELFNHINENKNLSVVKVETYKNILNFNCEQLTDKIKILHSHRNKRGITNGLGAILKTLTGNLDANDGRKYNELFEKINKNIYTLQNQNFEIVKLNKEMISRFNVQLNNVKHNEEVLKNQIIEIKDAIKNNNNWRIVTDIKDALNQLILLTINLKEMLSDIETSISFCGLNKIHSSIINMKTLRTIVNQNTELDFLEIVNLIKSHCRLRRDFIEYLIEIPMFDSKENVLLQITPIPIYHNNKLYILDENEMLIAKREDKLIIVERCVKNKNKYFCHTKNIKEQECVTNIVKTQKDTDCMYLEISNPLVILKIRNSNIAIIASNKNKTMKLTCANYVKTKNVIGVFKVKTDGNCSLNGQLLEISKYYNKKLIFKNVDIKMNKEQLTNKRLELKPISEQDIIIKELSAIENVNR